MERGAEMKRSLLVNILIIMLVTLVVLVALVMVIITIVGKSVYSRQRANELMSRADSIASEFAFSRDAGIPNDEIRKNLISKGLIESDTTTIIYLSGKEIWNSFSRPLIYSESVDIIEENYERVARGERISVTNDPHVIVVGIPIKNNVGHNIGSVFLSATTLTIADTLKRMTLEVTLAAVCAVLALLIPTYIVAGKLTRPIKEVADTALLMSAGNLSLRATENGTSEARHLAQSFNTLADNLQLTIEDLTVEKNRLSTILEGIGEGIISFDKSASITHYNAASIKLLGGSDGDKLETLAHYDLILGDINSSLASSEKIQRNIRVGEKIIQCRTSPIYDELSNLYGVTVLLRDITESERLENTRRDYVANVSHELRTPLASILSLADALNDGIVTDEADKNRYYSYIQHEAIRLSQLISDLLELSRLQSGGVAFTKRNENLNDVIYDVVDRMNGNASSRSKHIVTDIPEESCTAYTNGDRIEQVLVALIDNAIKHGSDNCDITVRLAPNGDESGYTVSVSNAAEIAASDLEHLFERFYKADHAHTGDGTGIGLSIAKEVLNLLGESITVEYADSVITFSFTVGSSEEVANARD